MFADRGTKKYAADKIALLGLFVLSLLLAWIVTAVRTAMTFTKPIKLHGTGLSVAVPDGGGWTSDKKWQYYENSFVLLSHFSTTAGQVSGQLQCVYVLAARRPSVKDWLAQRASQLGGGTLEIGKSEADNLVFDWAYLSGGKRYTSVIVGTVSLPDNRWIDIYITERIGQKKLAPELLEEMLKSLQYENNYLLERGSGVVTQVKNTGLDKLMPDLNNCAFYIVKDQAKRTVGFTIDTVQAVEPDPNRHIRAEGFLFLRQGLGQQKQVLFESDNSLEHFSWKTQARGIIGTTGGMLTAAEGRMRVQLRRLGTREKEYELHDASVPYVALEAIFAQMLTNNYKQIMVDVIHDDGRVIPAIISEAEQQTEAEPAARYNVKVEYIGQDDNTEQMYLDGSMRVIKKIVLHKGIHLLERTEPKELTKQFPEWADFILKKSKVVNRTGVSKQQFRGPL